MKKSHPIKLNCRHAATLLLIFAGTLAHGQSAYAGNSCKEMKKEACMSSASCSWIDSYTTKKGNTVKAYCRQKPKQKSGRLEDSNNQAGKTGKQG